ncbi:unnamed protein product, partial [Didymodactylos carnosus]
MAANMKVTTTSGITTTEERVHIDTTKAPFVPVPWVVKIAKGKEWKSQKKGNTDNQGKSKMNDKRSKSHDDNQKTKKDKDTLEVPLNTRSTIVVSPIEERHRSPSSSSPRTHSPRYGSNLGELHYPTMGYEASDDDIYPYVGDYPAYCPSYFVSGLPYPYYPPLFPYPYYGANDTYDQRTRLPSPYRQYTRLRSPYRQYTRLRSPYRQYTRLRSPYRSLPKKERQPYRSPSPPSPYYRQRSNSPQISQIT